MTNTGNRSAKFLLLFLHLLSLHAAWGQEKGDSSWQLKGFVDTYHAVRSEKPNDFMSSRTRVRGGNREKFWQFDALCLVQCHPQRLAERTHGF